MAAKGGIGTAGRLQALFGGLGGAARRLGVGALDLVYPPSCLVCRSATGAAQALCPACWGKVGFIERPFCERLGVPFASDLGDGLISPQAAADPPAYDRCRAVAVFRDGPARDLVHHLKYGDRPDLAVPMGRWMARAGRELLADADLLVPVPMHRRRLLARRFNQAAALAGAIGAATRRPVDATRLERVRATAPQVGLSRPERAANLQGAFAAPKGAFAGARLVLIDDVATTGATLNAAARALRRAGAARVDALVFARVVGEAALTI
ncbi:MAG: ComF family protein [Methylobacteriaceae bacterium]|nr:ComF family protein [Methylobacteriaceae bacterium]